MASPQKVVEPSKIEKFLQRFLNQTKNGEIQWSRFDRYLDKDFTKTTLTSRIFDAKGVEQILFLANLEPAVNSNSDLTPWTELTVGPFQVEVAPQHAIFKDSKLSPAEGALLRELFTKAIEPHLQRDEQLRVRAIEDTLNDFGI